MLRQFEYPRRLESKKPISALLATRVWLWLTMIGVCGAANLVLAAQPHPQEQDQQRQAIEKVKKSPQQWRSRLTDMEYYVTREKGTEQPYSGKFWNHKEQGVYTCKCCGQPLFDSKTKFESGTGWPSFYQPLTKNAINNIADYSAGMVRTEVTCRRCDAHLGHVFDDGPRPTGLRYCMNSVALGFQTPRQSVADQPNMANAGRGADSPEKLLDAIRIAVAENSKEKFLQCIAWEQLPAPTRQALSESKRSLTRQPVRSLQLASAGFAEPPDGYKYSIKPVGQIRLNYQDGSSEMAWTYGEHDGRYYLSLLVPKTDGTKKLQPNR